MVHEPLVSVIVPAWNAADTIQRALRSVLIQHWRPIEIIVVDDGSTDGTREAVEAIDGPIRYVHQERAGPAAARNRGIREAAGPILAFLDADDEWLAGRLQKTVEPLLRSPVVGLSYCRAWDERPDGRRIEHLAQAEQLRRPGGIYPPPHICTPAATIRAECFERCGLFDESMTNCEDTDLFIRIAEVYEVHCVPEPLVLIHTRPGSQRHQGDPDTRALAVMRPTLKALGRYPERYDREAALSAAFLSAGIQYLQAGRRWSALHDFLTSIAMRPNTRAAQFALRCFAPRWLASAAHRWRHGAAHNPNDKSDFH